MRGAIDIKGFMAIQTGSGVESTNSEIFMYPNIPIHRQDGAKDYLGSLGPIEKTSGSCVAVACGAKHTLVLTDHGEIFAFGDGRQVCEGNSEKSRLVGKPRPVAHCGASRGSSCLMVLHCPTTQQSRKRQMPLRGQALTRQAAIGGRAS